MLLWIWAAGGLDVNRVTRDLRDVITNKPSNGLVST